ncbi:von Willebrand factor type A domain-containing protein [Dongia sp.]|uniref:vWA domain-containing protein n=1 Tax=Dongia sp. TaxID=1977262 RepID=UPI0037532483
MAQPPQAGVGIGAGIAQRTELQKNLAPQGTAFGEGGLYGGAPSAYLPPENTENYLPIDENPVKQVAEAPVSTFSVDVDSGSYANVRRFILNGQQPPEDAVRVEEMINYFTYDFPAADDLETPFKTTTHIVKTPWNPDTYLLEIGIKGYQPKGERPAANLVFLIDVSGSMEDANKLPLLKSGMRMLTDQLRPEDKVSIVVYAGAAGVVLEPTSDKAKIKAALNQLQAGGSTAGGEGIQLAYAMAKQGRIDGGINRIILATDGDFNVGTTDIDALKKMIEENRKSGIALTTLGFGEGNYNDALMEQIADVGNGNYGYVDSLKEAKRLLVDQLDAMIQTIAKDVKVQVEFNPAVVAEYRLIGYENRALKREDFNNDQKDAGEIGAGHTVTALYEIALKGSKGLAVDPLRYGAAPAPTAEPGVKPEEFAFLRLRYKAPDGDVSKLIETPLATARLDKPESTNDELDFAAAVAAFGQKLRGGDHLKNYSYDQIAELAKAARGSDEDGMRAEFIELVEMSKALGSSGSVQ